MSNLGGTSVSEDTDLSNPKVENITAGAGISINDTNPLAPVVTNTGVHSLVAGTNATVDITDPNNPVINADTQVTIIDVSLFVQGAPTDLEKLATFIATKAFTLPASLVGSAAYAEVTATASALISVLVNDVSKGTIDFAIGTAVATFTFASLVTVAIGDRVQLVGQTTADATLADISITLRGTL